MKFVPQKKFVVLGVNGDGSTYYPREDMNPYSQIFNIYGYDTEEKALAAIVKKGNSGYIIVPRINMVPDYLLNTEV